MALVEVLATCLGAYARHCSVDELRDLMRRGALAPVSSAAADEQLGHALTLAAVAENASDRCAAGC